jgi:hypothetical protein
MRSIVLAVLAVVCTGAGVLTTPVPVVGTVFSIAAPALALLGVILGGMDVSRRKRAGQAGDAALVGVVLSALAFFPALATTVTCGVCNALWSSTPIQVRRDVRFDVRQGGKPSNLHFADGGVPSLPPPFAPGTVPGGRTDAAVAPGAVPGSADRPPAQRPPVIPPPPLPAGPRSP